MAFTFVVFIIAILAGFQTEVSSYSFDTDSKRHYIYWDSTVTEDIKDPSFSIKVEMGNFLDIVCPVAGGGITEDPTSLVSFNIINVTKKGYETCNGKGGRLIFSCNRPDQENKLTIKFQSISPSPFGFRFQECSEYYFLAVKKTDKKLGKHECNEESERLRIQVGCPDDKKPTPEATTTTRTLKPKTSFVDRILKEKMEKENKKPVIPDIIPVTKATKKEKKDAAVSASQSGNGGNGSSTTTHFNKYVTSFFAVISVFYLMATSS